MTSHNKTQGTDFLTAMDRCDRCSAAAYYSANLKSGGKLYFCRHHWLKCKESIEPKINSFIDESYKIKPIDEGREFK